MVRTISSQAVASPVIHRRTSPFIACTSSNLISPERSAEFRAAGIGIAAPQAISLYYESIN
jgi:hypothetical protein